MIPVPQPEFPEPFGAGDLRRRGAPSLFLKPGCDHDQHPALIEEQDAENPVELFHAELQNVRGQFLYKLPLHPVAVDAQALNKRVYPGRCPVIQRIYKLAGRDPSVRQLHILNGEFGGHVSAQKAWT